MILDAVLQVEEPVLLMLNHGESLSADVKKALETAEKQGLKVVKVNVDEKPEYAEQFEVGKHPVLAVWYCGEVVSRRSRPWGTDVDAMVKSASTLAPADPNAPAKPKEQVLATNKPIVVTDATFMDQVINNPLPVLVDFWATWCGPCRAVAPILEKLAAEFAGKVVVAKVDVDQNPALSQQFRITSIPTLMFVKNGKVVGQSAGAAPESALRDVMNQLMTLQV